MRVIPEINIMNGHCVKQLQGNYQYSEIVSHSPRKVAKMWEEQGASYLHIRDLDGLMTGHIRNYEVIKKLIDFISIPVEIYGGIYSLKEVENILHLGAEKVVLHLDSINFHFLKEVVNCFGADKIGINLQVSQGRNHAGTNEKGSIGDKMDLIHKVAELGIQAVECEGVIQEQFGFTSDFEYISHLMKESRMDVIVSGGVTTIKELELFQNIGAYGVILDEALYERRMELKSAIELFDRKIV